MKRLILLSAIFFYCVKVNYSQPGKPGSSFGYFSGLLELNISNVFSSADDGNVALNTIDKNYDTRWAAKGKNQWIRYYLDTTAIIKTVKIAWYKGNERQSSFDIQTSLDSTKWTTVFSGYSSGKTAESEAYDLPKAPARYLRIVAHGNNVNSWNSIAETKIFKDAALNPDSLLDTAMGDLQRAQAYAKKSAYPRSTNPDGTIKRSSPSNWTSGFFPGSLWLMYENTKDTIWKKRAEQWTAGLDGQKTNTSTHDVGFILYRSFGEGYRLTGNDTYKAIIIQGAKSLSTRFNPIVGCIKSWDYKNPNAFPVIIDNMMNLELLFLATKLSGDSSYYRIAVKHALTTMANHFRPDNSSYHVVEYNPLNGNVVSKYTVQGLNDSSDWARGQTWGLYGFTVCYRETGDIRFLNMAKKIADFYISQPNMPADLVPFWDFDAFDYRDASAACIASSALIELSQFAPDKSAAYYNFGINILKNLSSSAYSAVPGTNNNFILKHSVGDKPKNSEVDAPLVYADHFYLEALLRYKKPSPLVTASRENNQITLRWNTSTGATYYIVKRSLASTGPYTTIASNITATTFTNFGLEPGKTYYYRITPANEIEEGETSREVSVTTNQAPLVSIFAAPATGTTIKLEATASDPDGKITKVEFYNGTTLLNLNADVSSLASGTYTIKMVSGNKIITKQFVKQ